MADVPYRKQAGSSVRISAIGLCFALVLLMLGQHLSSSVSKGQGVAVRVILNGADSLTQPKAACTIKREYRPSELEKTWMENVEQWQISYCDNCNHTEEGTTTWLQTLKEHDELQPQHIRSNQSPAEALVAQQKLDARVFSSFKTTYDCGADGKREQITWIEPLAHGLRHPNAICNRGTDVMDRSYLLLAHQSEIQKATQLGNMRCENRTCQSFYFDLGATTLQNGTTEAGQGWFYDAYHRQGFEFDRFLLWEARVQNPEDIYRNVPKEDYHKYQYFNIPVNPNPANAENPVAILKRIAQPGDFVVFKLDIDNFEIEDVIFTGLLTDHEALALIDEFYFEEHVNFQPMLKNWKKQIDPNETLASSYKRFFNMRQAGVRAHSWV